MFVWGTQQKFFLCVIQFWIFVDFEFDLEFHFDFGILFLYKKNPPNQIPYFEAIRILSSSDVAMLFANLCWFWVWLRFSFEFRHFVYIQKHTNFHSNQLDYIFIQWRIHHPTENLNLLTAKHALPPDNLYLLLCIFVKTKWILYYELFTK